MSVDKSLSNGAILLQLTHHARFLQTAKIILDMLWFNVILGSIFIFPCFTLIIMIIIHCKTQKQRKIKIEPRIKLNQNRYTLALFINNRVM